MADGPKAIHRPDPWNRQDQAPSGEHRIHQTAADRGGHARDRQRSVRAPGAWRSYERTTDENRGGVVLISATRWSAPAQSRLLDVAARPVRQDGARNQGKEIIGPWREYRLAGEPGERRHQGEQVGPVH